MEKLVVSAVKCVQKIKSHKFELTLSIIAVKPL